MRFLWEEVRVLHITDGQFGINVAASSHETPALQLSGVFKCESALLHLPFCRFGNCENGRRPGWRQTVITCSLTTKGPELLLKLRNLPSCEWSWINSNRDWPSVNGAYIEIASHTASHTGC